MSSLLRTRSGNTRYTLPVILAAALLVRVAWVIFFATKPKSDAIWYFRSAAEIAEGLGYNNPDGIPTAFFPVGYPAFLGAVFYFFGSSTAVASAANIILDLGIIILTFLIARLIFHSEATALMSAAMIALLPSQIAFNALVYSEILLLFLLLSAVYLVLTDSSRPIVLLGAGIAAGLAVLAKPQAIFVPFIILSVQAFSALRTGAPLRPFLFRGGVILALILVTVSPWALRNYLTFGKFIPVSTNGGVNLFIANNPRATGTFINRRKVVRALPRSLIATMEHHPGNIEAGDKDYRRLALQFIRENPGAFLRMVPAKLYHLYHSDTHSLVINARGVPKNRKTALAGMHWIADGIYYAMLVFAAASCLALVHPSYRRRAARWSHALAGPLIVLYFTALYSLFFGLGRFHHPMTPWFAMYASAFVVIFLGHDEA